MLYCELAALYVLCCVARHCIEMRLASNRGVHTPRRASLNSHFVTP